MPGPGSVLGRAAACSYSPLLNSNSRSYNASRSADKLRPWFVCGLRVECFLYGGSGVPFLVTACVHRLSDFQCSLFLRDAFRNLATKQAEFNRVHTRSTEATEASDVSPDACGAGQTHAFPGKDSGVLRCRKFGFALRFLPPLLA